MCPKDADGMAISHAYIPCCTQNSQNSIVFFYHSECSRAREQYDQDLHCLPTPICPSTVDFYGTVDCYRMRIV